MAESQILGLFASPADVERAVREEVRQRAPQFASAANQRLFTNVAQAGAVFDPRVQRARDQQQVARGITSTFGTAEYYREMAEQFRQRGMLQSAIVAADKADQIDKAIMDKATAKYGTISFNNYGKEATNIRRLVLAIEKAKNAGERIALQKELEEAFKRGEQSVIDREAQQAGEIKAAEYEEKRYDAALTKIEKQLDDAQKNARSVYSIRKNIVNNISNINTGFGAEAITGLQALAGTLGISTARMDELAGNTQAAQSIIGQLMLDQIKTLGTNPSNADREFLMKTLPSVTNRPEAIEKIAQFLEEKAKFAKEDAKQRLAHLRKHKSLLDPPYESPVWDALENLYAEANITGTRTAMSDEEYELNPYSDDEFPALNAQASATPQTPAQTTEEIAAQQEADGEAAVQPEAAPTPTTTPAPTPEPTVMQPQRPISTEVSLGKRIEQIDGDLSVASDMTQEERSALVAERNQLIGEYQRQRAKRNDMMDLMIKGQMSSFLNETQKNGRLDAMSRGQKLTIVHNMLRSRLARGPFTPEEQKFADAIEAELQQLGLLR